MGTDPIDIAGLHAAADGPWKGMPAGTTVGHVHLHVGDIATASSFYSDTLGFDRIVWNYPGALFLSAGGYHHHLGTNTWAGRARSPAPDDARLLEWTIELPDAASRAAVANSLETSGHTIEHDTNPDGAFVTSDPWGTKVRIG
jgi:catechol 2,3-dioxygenase